MLCCIRPKTRPCVASLAKGAFGDRCRTVCRYVLIFYKFVAQIDFCEACLTSYCNQNSTLENAVVFGIRLSDDFPQGNNFQYVHGGSFVFRGFFFTNLLFGLSQEW